MLVGALAQKFMKEGISSDTHDLLKKMADKVSLKSMIVDKLLLQGRKSVLKTIHSFSPSDCLVRVYAPCGSTTFNSDPFCKEVKFSPDSSKLAMVLDKKTLTVFDVACGERLVAIPHNLDIKGLIFSPDGSKIVTEERESEPSERSAAVYKVNFNIHVWDFKKLEKSGKDESAQEAAKPLYTIPTFYFNYWNYRTGRYIPLSGYCRSIKFTPLKDFLVVIYGLSYEDRSAVALYNAATGEHLRSFHLDRLIIAAELIEGGSELAVIDAFGDVSTWKIDDQKDKPHSIKRLDWDCRAMYSRRCGLIQEDGDRIAVVSTQGDIQINCFSEPSHYKHLKDCFKKFIGAGFSSEGDLFIVYDEGADLLLMEKTDPEIVKLGNGPLKVAVSSCLGDSEQLDSLKDVLMDCEGYFKRAIEYANWHEKKVPDPHWYDKNSRYPKMPCAGLSKISVSKDGLKFATVSTRSGHVNMWQLATCQSVLNQFQVDLTKVSFSDIIALAKNEDGLYLDWKQLKLEDIQEIGDQPSDQLMAGVQPHDALQEYQPEVFSPIDLQPSSNFVPSTDDVVIDREDGQREQEAQLTSTFGQNQLNTSRRYGRRVSGKKKCLGCVIN